MLLPLHLQSWLYTISVSRHKTMGIQCFYFFISRHGYIPFLFLPIKPWVYSAFISSFAAMVIYSVVVIHYKVSISSNEIIVMQ